MDGVDGGDEPRGWAPLEPSPDTPPMGAAHPPLPPAARSGAWAPPQGPPGWTAAPPPPPYGYPPYGAFAAPLPKGGDARTGPLPLHPMSVGDVLDGAFKLLKANFRTILIVVAVILVPIELVSAFAVRNQVSIGILDTLRDPTLVEDREATMGLGSALTSIVSALLSLLTGPLIAGAVSRVVAASYVGEEIGPSAVLKMTLRRMFPLLAASIMVFLAEAVGVLFCIVPGLLLFALYTAVTPALMIEEIGPIQAMRRSWRLLRPRMWGVLGIAVLARLIAGVLGNLLGGVPTVAATLLGGSFAWLFVAAGSVVSSLVSAPIVAIVATLLYFDGRIRNEGFDLQMMARDFERSSPPTSALG